MPNKLTCSIIYTYKTRERKVNKNKKATFPSFFFFYTFSTRSDARITLDRASRSRRVRVFNAPNLVGKLRCKRSSCVAGPREFVTFPSGREKNGQTWPTVFLSHTQTHTKRVSQPRRILPRFHPTIKTIHLANQVNNQVIGLIMDGEYCAVTKSQYL